MARIREKTLKFPGLDNVYTFADEADLFDANVACAVDEYRIYNGDLYCCTTAHTGAWDASHFKAVKMGNEVLGLKTAITQNLISKNTITLGWVRGYINNSTGSIGTDAARCTSQPIYTNGGQITIKVSNGFTVEKIGEYDSDGFIGVYRNLNITSEYNFETIKGHYYRLQTTKSGTSTLQPSDISTSDIYVECNAFGFKNISKTIELEHGAYTSTNYRYYTDRTSILNNWLNKYPLLVGDADAISVNATCTMIYRDSSGAGISSRTAYANSVYPLPDTTYYVDIELTNARKPEKCVATIYNATHGLEDTKRIYRNDGKRLFSAFVTDQSTNTITYANLLLPPNYNPSVPVPCILWFDGSGNMIDWGTSFADNKLQYLYYLRDEGFAVCSIFGWNNRLLTAYPNCGRAFSYPSPTNLKSFSEGVKYICDRYSIDPDNIHIMCKSQGGQIALYYASHQDFPIKSIGMFSPVLDFLSMSGEAYYADTRKALYDDMGFVGDKTYFGGDTYSAYSEDGVAFLSQNKTQLCQLNEAWANLVGGTLDSRFESAMEDGEKFWTGHYWTDPTKTDIYTNDTYAKLAKIPVKIWGASDDDNTPYLKMVEVVKQLQNGGCQAVMRTFDRGTGAHSCADVGTNIVASVTTALGITHTDVCTGWVENIAWIREHMQKTPS